MNRRLLIIIGGSAVGLIFLVLIGLGVGCFRTKEPQEVQTFEQIELTYYKLFDDSDVIEPLIQQYQADHANVKINYRKFTDPEEYYDLILNELAEGEGPDIFSVPNTWFLKNHKKVSPAPQNIVPPDAFEATYVAVTYDDLVRVNPETGRNSVYALPMTVDTLALYYNKDQFEDSIPERGRPAITWEGIKEDVFTLTKQDQSFERFEVAGIAMGHADNITRAVDIMYLLMLQYGGDFYDETMSEAIFANQQGVASDGRPIRPGIQALDFYTSFSNPANKNYSWNPYLADANSEEKEITTFARGKVSMVIGYSNMYEQIIDQISELQARGLSTIDPDSIRIATIPQVIDPAVSTEKRDAYAHYFTETVARTSENPEWAWDFLLFLTSRDSLSHYYDQTRKPTSRRDMIEEQQDDPIYGVFAEQIGFAESIPIYDEEEYAEVIKKAINAVLATKSPQDAMKIAQEEINAILPDEGLQPQVTVTEEDEEAS
jgi:ABC-type glycerol-3-phosphate transport system substrate-binding protein